MWSQCIQNPLYSSRYMRMCGKTNNGHFFLLSMLHELLFQQPMAILSFCLRSQSLSKRREAIGSTVDSVIVRMNKNGWGSQKWKSRRRDTEESYEGGGEWIYMLPLVHKLFFGTFYISSLFRCSSAWTSKDNQSRDAETLSELCKVDLAHSIKSRSLGRAREAYIVVLDLPCKCF